VGEEVTTPKFKLPLLPITTRIDVDSLTLPVDKTFVVEPEPRLTPSIQEIPGDIAKHGGAPTLGGLLCAVIEIRHAAELLVMSHAREGLDGEWAAQWSKAMSGVGLTLLEPAHSAMLAGGADDVPVSWMLEAFGTLLGMVEQVAGLRAPSTDLEHVTAMFRRLAGQGREWLEAVECAGRLLEAGDSPPKRTGFTPVDVTHRAGRGSASDVAAQLSEAITERLPHCLPAYNVGYVTEVEMEQDVMGPRPCVRMRIHVLIE
jgi:hypothetical protein